MNTEVRTLDLQRIEFSNRRLIATPIAGLIAWLAVGIAGLILPERQVIGVLFAATGSIVYLGMFISRFTGENFLRKNKPKNAFDSLFLFTVAMALLVYAIAIPFFLIDYSTLPMTVGILSGIMWLPLSWIIRHWVGVFHGIARTAVILFLHYAFPTERFVYIPFAIVALYVITIVILENRNKR